MNRLHIGAIIDFGAKIAPSRSLCPTPHMDDSNVLIEDSKRNRLLSLLTEEDFKKVLADSILVSLPAGKEILDEGGGISTIYFPLDCIVSIVVGAGNHVARVETAMIGNEGGVGVYSILHGERAVGANIVQFAGEALRTPASTFMRCVKESDAFEKLMRQFTFALTRQIILGKACDRLHTIEERCTRLLLSFHDRAGKDTFPLTQGFLATMLGVRRATVNLATGVLKRACHVGYVRGQVTIVDRPGLESASCPCYELIRREYQRVGDDSSPTL